MSGDLRERVRRIYAALGETVEEDVSTLKPKVIRRETSIAFFQDFRGGLTKEQIVNVAHTAIHNIANLVDHLRQWAKRHSLDPMRVDETIANSLDLQVIIDLSNVDKHGYPPRDRGLSGKAPRLVDVDRVMRISAGSEPHSGAVVVMTPTPQPHVHGSGSVNVVVTGRIIDDSDNFIGELQGFMNNAVAAWETLLQDFRLH